MKALTVRQPWATLIEVGAKRVETRSWSTRYRGRIAIHAAKSFPGKARDLCRTQPFLRALEEAWADPDRLPLGKVLAIAELVDVERIGYHVMPLHQTNEGHQRELAFGDYREGRYAWRLANAEPFLAPIQAKGALGLWEWS